jgi:type I restriction enzyme, S subunit
VSFPGYPTSKDTDVEWLGPIPAHWDVCPLKAVASCNDEVLPEGTDADTLIEYVEISDVEEGKGIKRTEQMTFGSAPSRARRVIRDGDVLISTVRTYLRAIATVANPPPNLVASTGFAAIRPRRTAPAFLGYLLHCEYFMSEVIARSVGISYPAINASDLMSLKCPIPRMDEQVAIGHFLDRETAKIDALIEAQKRLIELLKEKRQAVISQAVTKGLDTSVPMKNSGLAWQGNVPMHWRPVRLKSLFRQQKRQGYAEKEVLSVYRELGVILKDSRSDNFNKTPEDVSTYQLVEPGDLVVNKMKAWQGSLGISGLEGITSPDYVVFTAIHSEMPDYLHLLLRSRAMVGTYLSISNGIRLAQWRMEPEAFLAQHVFIPPLDEQKPIVSFVSGQMEKWDALMVEADEAISLLQQRRSALISAAVTGKIDVRGLAPQPESVAA